MKWRNGWTRKPWTIALMLGIGLLPATEMLAVPAEGATFSRSAVISSQPSVADQSWLTEVNKYRLAAGLVPVTDNPAWDAGLEAHFNYLAKTPASYRTGQYASAHTENPASPFYTPAGAQEGGSSDLVEGYSNATPIQLIDVWYRAPLHAVGMLRAELRQVAFAYDPATGDAGIDVISGLTGIATTGPVLFPGPGVVTNLTSFGGESPDPLQTCGWSGDEVGLPLVALLPNPPAAGLTATLNGPTGGESTSAGDLCVVDANTYVSSDPVYGPVGLSILQSDNVVILIPRNPLVAGTYSATISQPSSAQVKWSFTAAPPLTGPVVGMDSTFDGGGYWLTNAEGAVSAHGDAVYAGSMAGVPLNSPIAHMVATPSGKGYWLVAGDGGTFSFGDAGFYGSMGDKHLNAPVVDMAPTSDGKGYWLVASDGGIFAFGDARFHGSMGGVPLNQPMVGVTFDGATGGYWEVASDGGIFAFDAPFFGSTGNIVLAQPVNGMASTPDNSGYWFVATDGGIFAYGDAGFFGSAGGGAATAPIMGMAPDKATGGYWLVDISGRVYSYNANDYGSD